MTRTCVVVPETARVLCFAPHPDDEVIGSGGTLHQHQVAGGTVQVVIATDGIAGDPDQKFDPSSYGERRRDECRRATQQLAVAEPVFWGLPDSCTVVEADKLRLVGMVKEAVTGFLPDIVYLPWQLDDNPDHLVLHEVVTRGLREVDYRGVARGYEVWAPIPQPDLVVDITAVLEVKRNALLCHETQFAYSDLAHQVLGMNAYRSLLLSRNQGYGEAFQRVKL